MPNSLALEDFVCFIYTWYSDNWDCKYALQTWAASFQFRFPAADSKLWSLSMGSHGAAQTQWFYVPGVRIVVGQCFCCLVTLSNVGCDALGSKLCSSVMHFVRKPFFHLYVHSEIEPKSLLYSWTKFLRSALAKVEMEEHSDLTCTTTKWRNFNVSYTFVDV